MEKKAGGWKISYPHPTPLKLTNSWMQCVTALLVFSLENNDLTNSGYTDMILFCCLLVGFEGAINMLKKGGDKAWAACYQVKADACRRHIHCPSSFAVTLSTSLHLLCTWALKFPTLVTSSRRSTEDVGCLQVSCEASGDHYGGCATASNKPAKHPLHHCSALFAGTVTSYDNLMTTLPVLSTSLSWHLQTGNELAAAGRMSSARICNRFLLCRRIFWCPTKTVRTGVDKVALMGQMPWWHEI